MSNRKRPKLDLLLVIDFEALCWDTPNSSQRSEIIEIGYCLVNQLNSTIEKEGQILVLPDSQDVSPFSTSIHGYVLEDLLGKPNLVDAFKQLETIVGRGLKTIPWASFGDYDREQLLRECARKGIEYPLSRTHFNVKTMFSLLTRQSALFNLDNALKQKGLAFEGIAHKGVYDAKNTAVLLFNILGRPIGEPNAQIVRLLEDSPDSPQTKVRVLATEGRDSGTVVFSIVPAAPIQPPVKEQLKLLIELIQPAQIRISGLLAFALGLDPLDPKWDNRQVEIVPL